MIGFLVWEGLALGATAVVFLMDFGQEGPQNPQNPPMNLCLESTLVLHQGLALVRLVVQLVKVLFLCMKGNTQPWKGAGPAIVLHRLGSVAGSTDLNAATGERGDGVENIIEEFSDEEATSGRVEVGLVVEGPRSSPHIS